MKKTWNQVILYSIIIVVLAAAGWAISNMLLGSDHPKAKPPPVVTTDLRTERIHKLLVEWVYSHSSRISKDTCKIIVDECMKTNKPLLMLALIQVESEFSPTVISDRGAIGLCQVMFPSHEKALISAGIIKEKRDLFDIPCSIKAGNFIITGMLKSSSGDIVKALNLYLGGYNVTYQHRILANLGTLYILTQEL